MLGTDYPFPLGEVRICDTWPGKVVEQSKYSDSVKVDIMLDTHHIRVDIVILEKSVLGQCHGFLESRQLQVLKMNFQMPIQIYLCVM